MSHANSSLDHRSQVIREFRNALLFKDSVLVDRLFRVFDVDDDGEISFQEFIACLSILSTKATQEEKLQCKWKYLHIFNNFI